MTFAFERVTARYGRHTAFRDATFALDQGRIMGLIGPNGAGKTTMLRIAAGLIRPAEGHVRCEGPVMYFGGEMTIPGGCRADRWSALLGAAPAEPRRLRRLSRGTRQMIGLRAVLGTDAWNVGLLDEPWEGLDPEGARWLRETLHAHRLRGAAIIASSHRLHDIAEVCDVYGFLAQGSFGLVSGADAPDRRADGSTLMKLFDDVARRS